MKKTLIPAILSAALILSSCSSQPLPTESEAASTPPTATLTEPTTTYTLPQTTAQTPAETENTDFQDTKGSTQETEAETTRKKDFPGEINLPVTYQSAENKKGKPCRSIMKGLEYEDFPAKEDIEPAIQCAFDAYFCKERIYHHNTEYAMEGIPCTIENLSFSSGLYLDFNGDGEKESLIVVENDSDMPYTGDSMVTYYRNEFDNTVFSVDEKLAHGGKSSSYIYALIYDDCIDIMIEEFFYDSEIEYGLCLL